MKVAYLTKVPGMDSCLRLIELDRMSKEVVTVAEFYHYGDWETGIIEACNYVPPDVVVIPVPQTIKVI